METASDSKHLNCSLYVLDCRTCRDVELCNQGAPLPRGDCAVVLRPSGRCWVMVERVGLLMSHPQPALSGHPCTVGVNQDPQVCHDVQGDIMTERQLVLVRLLGVPLLWLL